MYVGCRNAIIQYIINVGRPINARGKSWYSSSKTKPKRSQELSLQSKLADNLAVLHQSNNMFVVVLRFH